MEKFNLIFAQKIKANFFQSFALRLIRLEFYEPEELAIEISGGALLSVTLKNSGRNLIYIANRGQKNV